MNIRCYKNRTIYHANFIQSGGTSFYVVFRNIFIYPNRSHISIASIYPAPRFMQRIEKWPLLSVCPVPTSETIYPARIVGNQLHHKCSVCN